MWNIVTCFILEAGKREKVNLADVRVTWRIYYNVNITCYKVLLVRLCCPCQMLNMKRRLLLPPTLQRDETTTSTPPCCFQSLPLSRWWFTRQKDDGSMGVLSLCSDGNRTEAQSQPTTVKLSIPIHAKRILTHTAVLTYKLHLFSPNPVVKWWTLQRESSLAALTWDVRQSKGTFPWVAGISLFFIFFKELGDYSDNRAWLLILYLCT